MSLLSLLNKSATIERSTPSRAATGEVSASWSAVQSNVPCRIEPAGTDAELRHAGFSLTADFVGYFPGDADLRPQTSSGLGDRVVIESVRYLVLGVRPTAGKDKALVAALRRQA